MIQRVVRRLFAALSWVLNRLVALALPLVPRAVVRRVAARYIAGETLDEAVAVVRALNAAGFAATVDVLGEEVSEPSHASQAVEDYLRLLDRIVADRLDSSVSLKLTQLGVRLSREQCEANLRRIVVAARDRGLFVRVDMEDSSLTQTTLDIVRAMRAEAGNTGPVIQACLRRSAGDVERLVAERSNFRLCKGIYVEPKEIAFRDREEVRTSYLQLARRAVGSGAYVGLATHDAVLIDALRAEIRERRIPRDQYEFQALLGVPITETLRALLAEGHRVRIYVPYGSHWYPYSVRRLEENPAVAGHVLRAAFRRDRGLLGA